MKSLESAKKKPFPDWHYVGITVVCQTHLCITLYLLCPQAEFLLGKRYYSDDLFDLAAEHFEVAVNEYFTAYQECRVLCEGSYNYDGYSYMEYSADLFQSITGKAGCL